MSEQKIEAHKVTKPIQLLAAWLVGLIIIDSVFLSGAATIARPEWASGLLIIAAILNVPVFLAAIFLLQTKFRPEMQEDTYYSKYLDQKTNIVKEGPKLTKQEIKIFELEELQKKSFAYMEEISAKIGTRRDEVAREHISWDTIRVSVNDLLPEYKRIREFLKENKIPIVDIYGSTNDSPEVPDKFIISIRETLSITHIQELLLGLKDCQLEGVKLFDEPFEEDDVYIGSYDISAYSSLDEEFWSLIAEDSIDLVDLKHMLKKKIVVKKRKRKIAL